MCPVGTPSPRAAPVVFWHALAFSTTASTVPEGTGPSPPDDMVVLACDDVIGRDGDDWFGSSRASRSPVGVAVTLAKAPSRPEPSTVGPKDEAPSFPLSAAPSSAGLRRVLVSSNTASRFPSPFVHPTAEEQSRLRPTGVSQKPFGVGGGFALLNAVEGELAFALNTGGLNRWKACSSADDFPACVSFSINSGEPTPPNPVGLEGGGLVRILSRMWKRSCCDTCR